MQQGWLMATALAVVFSGHAGAAGAPAGLFSSSPPPERRGFTLPLGEDPDWLRTAIEAPAPHGGIHGAFNSSGENEAVGGRWSPDIQSDIALMPGKDRFALLADTSGSPVPEPSSWLMLLAGLILVYLIAARELLSRDKQRSLRAPTIQTDADNAAKQGSNP